MTTKTTKDADPKAAAKKKLADLAGRIKEQIEQAGVATRTALGRHREAGRLLTEARRSCEAANSKWGAWVKLHCGITQQHANLLIKLHGHWDRVGPALRRHGPLTLKEALAVIRGKDPGEGRERPPRRSITEKLVRKAVVKAGLKQHLAKILQLLAGLGIKVKGDADSAAE